MRSILILVFAALSVNAFAFTYPMVQKLTPFAGSRFYVPNDSAKHTTIVMLHGSEGGSEPFVDLEANVLSTQGYAVMVYCYFDCLRGLTDPHQSLTNVETTGVLNAVEWARQQTGSNGKVVVYGFSRGAELTMIIGSLTFTPANKPDALIAHAPSDVFVESFNWAWETAACWLCKISGTDKCSDTSTAFKWNLTCGNYDPNRLDFTQSAWLITGAHVPAQTRIPVERYDRPILLTVGLADQVWPPAQTKRIEATLKAAGRTPEVHYFPGQGHIFTGPDETKRREIVVDFLNKI